jgi:hyperosmotically inducible periplasmic protein
VYDPVVDRLERLGAMLLAALVLASVFVSCARQVQPTLDDDLALAMRVHSRLEVDPQLRPFGLTVAAHEGTVVLRGQVEDEIDRQRARAISRDTPDVAQVVDLLEVVTPPHRVDSPFRDAWVATRVKARLVADPDLDASALSVDARDGVVILSGRVVALSDRQAAELLARSTQGVADVINELEVEPRG